MTRARRLLVSLALAALPALAAMQVGCGFAELHEVQLRAAPPARTSPDIYLADPPADAPPEGPVYDIALLQAVGYGSAAEGDEVVKLLAARGQELGCDAVERVRIDQGYTMAHAYGICVKYARIAAPGPSRSSSRSSSRPPSRPMSAPASPSSSPSPSPSPPADRAGDDASDATSL